MISRVNMNNNGDYNVRRFSINRENREDEDEDEKEKDADGVVSLQSPALVYLGRA
jgi:hypothetical protein